MVKKAIKPKVFASLTWATVARFIGRKKAHVLSVICDTENNKIYPVPLEIEHVDWAATILQVTRTEIRQNPSSASHLVPAVIELSPTREEVVGLLTGTSGLEIGFRVRHTKEQLESAHKMTLRFITKGEIPFEESTFSATIIRKWQAKL